MRKLLAIIFIIVFLGVAGGAALMEFGVVGPGRTPRVSERDSAKFLPFQPTSERLEPTPPQNNDLFQDMTIQSGISFSYRNGQEAGHCAILESLGGGAAVVDYDGDNDLDLYLVGGGRFGADGVIEGMPDGLYRNRGDWNFETVLDQAALHGLGYGHGCTVGDYDNDGFPDLLITHYAGVLLRHNNGDGSFSDCSLAAGLTDRRWGSSAAWGDFDNDGALDLFICHYVNWSFQNHPLCGEQRGIRDVCTPRLFTALGSTLYHNNSDGTFDDLTSTSGIRPDGKSLGLVVADLDGDSCTDIYVANDTTANHLYWNRGNGTFHEQGLSSGTALGETGIEEGSMGCDADDFDCDGRPDLWVVNYEDEPNALYRNEGRRIFTHVSESTGLGAVSRPFVGWGTGFFDLDNDGFLDLFASNGHVLYHHYGAPLRQRPLLHRNKGNGRFLEISSQGGEYFRTGHLGRGTALGDLDNDGRTDLVFVHQNEPCALLRNLSPEDNQWLRVHPVGTTSNRDAVGTVVTAEVAGRRLVRLVKGGGSYLSQSDRRILFGLGRQQQIELLEIRWPGGDVQNVHELAGNNAVKVVERGKVKGILE